MFMSIFFIKLYFVCVHLLNISLFAIIIRFSYLFKGLTCNKKMTYRARSPMPFSTVNSAYQPSYQPNKAQINFQSNMKSVPFCDAFDKINLKSPQNKPNLIIPPLVFPTVPIPTSISSASINPQVRQERSQLINKDQTNLTDDLAELKAKLQNIMDKNPVSPRINTYSQNSKSSDNLYSPHHRLQEFSALPKYSVQSKDQSNHKSNLFSDNQFYKGPTKQRRTVTEPYQIADKNLQSISTYNTEQKFKLQFDETQSSPLNFKRQSQSKPLKLAQTIQDQNKDNRIQSFNTTRQYKSYLAENDVSTSLEYIKPKKLTYIDYQLSLDKQKQQIELQKKLDSLELQKLRVEQENENLKTKIEILNIKHEDLFERYNKLNAQYQQCKNRETLLIEKVSKIQKQLVEIKNKSRNSFDDLLKTQMEETNKIRKSIEEKNEEILRLNETILFNRRKTEQAINDAGIEKLKYLAQKKQIQQANEIEILKRDNEIKNLKNALHTFENKLQVAIKDNKAKDKFIQQYLVGRAEPGEEKEYIQNILSKYQITFPTNKLTEKLLEEQKEIELLKKIIERPNFK